MITRPGRRAPDPDEQIKRMERVVRERVDSGRSTGIAAGMVLADGRTHCLAYGDAGHGRRLDEHSVFEIGSITKVFTATLLALMAQDGELALTDMVTDLLPAGVSLPSRGGRQITLLDLATQTSGLPRLPANMEPADDANPYADYSVTAMYEFLGGYVLPRDPGAKYEYSNLGVGLLGHALALRAGTSYEELVRERILEPLGMTSTAITVAGEMAQRFACGHDAAGSVVAHWDLATLAGAGALRSSIGDMMRFAQANLGAADGGSLGQALAATHAPRRRIGFPMRIGLNWHILGYRSATILMHDGGTAGFFSFLGVQPARRTAAVVLGNSTAEDVADIGLHLINRRMRLAPPPKERTAITLPAELLERYVGVYEADGMRAEITRSCDGLSAEVAGSRTHLYPEARTRFFARAPDAQVVFKLAPGGAATGAVLHQHGQKIRFKKVA